MKKRAGYIFKQNKLDFNGHQQRIPKHISKKSYSVGSNQDTKVLYKIWSQKIRLFWRYVMLKNRTISLAEIIWGPKLKNQTFKLLETIERSSWFYGCVKCPNTDLFLVRIFLYSDWIRRFTEYRRQFMDV